MNVVQTKLPGVLIFEPKVFSDGRGFFLETYSDRRYAEAGVKESFVQDNVSFSEKGVLRGLHFQHPQSQGKLVQVLSGSVFDVAVDIRRGSETFGKWVMAELSGNNHRQMYIPSGIAHGFCVLSDTAMFSYKCTAYYNQAAENGIIWNDPDINIDWPVEKPVLSDKDMALKRLKDIPLEMLPSRENYL